jgi:hypothetical protein
VKGKHFKYIFSNFCNKLNTPQPDSGPVPISTHPTCTGIELKLTEPGMTKPIKK